MSVPLRSGSDIAPPAGAKCRCGSLEPFRQWAGRWLCAACFRDTWERYQNEPPEGPEPPPEENDKDAT
jgi:hypothetical protein